jgi:hypothetical protein
MELRATYKTVLDCIPPLHRDHHHPREDINGSNDSGHDHDHDDPHCQASATTNGDLAEEDHHVAPAAFDAFVHVGMKPNARSGTVYLETRARRWGYETMPPDVDGECAPLFPPSSSADDDDDNDNCREDGQGGCGNNGRPTNNRPRRKRRGFPGKEWQVVEEEEGEPEPEDRQPLHTRLDARALMKYLGPPEVVQESHDAGSFFVPLEKKKLLTDYDANFSHHDTLELYLCEFTYYASLACEEQRRKAGKRARPVIFVHVPP